MTTSSSYALENANESVAHFIMAISGIVLFLVLRFFTRTRSFFVFEPVREVNAKFDARLAVTRCAYPWLRGFTWFALVVGLVASVEGTVMHYRYAPKFGVSAGVQGSDADGGALVSSYRDEIEAGRRVHEPPPVDSLKRASSIDTPRISGRAAGVAAVIIAYLQAWPAVLMLNGIVLTATSVAALWVPKRLVQPPPPPAAPLS